jgi:hypothetical protein
MKPRTILEAVQEGFQSGEQACLPAVLVQREGQGLTMEIPAETTFSSKTRGLSVTEFNSISRMAFSNEPGESDPKRIRQKRSLFLK